MTFGVDVGQKVDPTAIALAETETRTSPEGREEVHFTIRYLQRLPLGTSYVEVARRLTEIVANLREQARRDGRTVDVAGHRVFLDATGVGKPVADLLASAGLRVTPC